jgi:DNA integrity scanning protein DisA with diadenylate cyclase activity
VSTILKALLLSLFDKNLFLRGFRIWEAVLHVKKILSQNIVLRNEEITADREVSVRGMRIAIGCVIGESVARIIRDIMA